MKQIFRVLLYVNVVWLSACGRFWGAFTGGGCYQSVPPVLHDTFSKLKSALGPRKKSFPVMSVAELDSLMALFGTWCGKKHDVSMSHRNPFCMTELSPSLRGSRKGGDACRLGCCLLYWRPPGMPSACDQNDFDRSYGGHWSGRTWRPLVSSQHKLADKTSWLVQHALCQLQPDPQLSCGQCDPSGEIHSESANRNHTINVITWANEEIEASHLDTAILFGCLIHCYPSCSHVGENTPILIPIAESRHQTPATE